MKVKHFCDYKKRATSEKVVRAETKDQQNFTGVALTSFNKDIFHQPNLIFAES